MHMRRTHQKLLASLLLCGVLAGGAGLAEPVQPVFQVLPARAVSFQKRINEAAEENEDTIGWIFIDGLDIDYPVLQAQDNDYYLDRGADGSSFWHGCVYADYRNTFNEGYYTPRNITLYAHNKDDHQYFANLRDYRLLETARPNPYIYFSTKDGDEVYKVFAAFYAETQLNYNTANPSDDLMAQLIAEVKKRSEITFDVPVDSSDQLLTLSTCCYRYTYANGQARTDQRFVVMARKLRAGESVDDKVSMWQNPNPKAPQFRN